MLMNLSRVHNQFYETQSVVTKIGIFIDGVKIASCFHTGYFLMRTLRPLAVQIGKKTEGAKDKFDIYIDDFCEKYEEVMPLRTEFV